MKFSVKTTLVILAATFMSLSAIAERGGRGSSSRFDNDFQYRDRPGHQQQAQKFVLDVNQDIFMDGDVLKIKQMLNNQYPRRNFRNFDIKAVVLLAKAGRRGLDAQLVVGQNYESYHKELPFMGPGSFRQYGNFDRVRFKVPRNMSSRGRVQVHFSGQGRGKVEKVIVRAVRKQLPPRRLQFTKIDEFRTEKFFLLTERIRVRQQDVKAIRLSASRNPVDVSSVVVVYANGDTDYLPGLEGIIYENDYKTVKIGGRNGAKVRRIEITAASLSPLGSRGKIAVSIGK